MAQNTLDRTGETLNKEVERLRYATNKKQQKNMTQKEG